jgi:hypothetical protein
MAASSFGATTGDARIAEGAEIMALERGTGPGHATDDVGPRPAWTPSLRGDVSSARTSRHYPRADRDPAGAPSSRPRTQAVPSRDERASRRTARTTSATHSSISRPLTRPEGRRRAATASDGSGPPAFNSLSGAGRLARRPLASAGLVRIYRRACTRECPPLLAASGARGAPWTRVGLSAIESTIHYQRALVNLRASKPMRTLDARGLDRLPRPSAREVVRLSR